MIKKYHNLQILTKLTAALLDVTNVVDSESLPMGVGNLLSLTKVAMDLSDEAQSNVMHLLELFTMKISQFSFSMIDEDELRLMTQLSISGMNLMEVSRLVY